MRHRSLFALLALVACLGFTGIVAKAAPLNPAPPATRTLFQTTACPDLTGIGGHSQAPVHQLKTTRKPGSPSLHRASPRRSSEQPGKTLIYRPVSETIDLVPVSTIARENSRANYSYALLSRLSPRAPPLDLSLVS